MLVKIAFFYDVLRSAILPLAEIEGFIPKKGLIYDLGCGKGVLSKFLAKNPKRIVVGVDKEIRKLPKLELPNLQFIHSDIIDFKFKSASAVIISDVLHHLKLKNQEILLKNTAEGLNKKGMLIIKEIDKSEFIRSSLSRFWDFIFYPKDKIYYQKAENLKDYLETIGFSVKVLRPTRLFPGSTALFICYKNAP